MSRRLAIPESFRRDRRRASDPTTSAWVSANAGSGKTHVLTQRVLRLLLDGTPRRRRSSASPYTKAAAANMAERVFGKLAQWTSLDDKALDAAIVDCGAARAGRARPRLRAAIIRPRHRDARAASRFQTLHAFCREAAAGCFRSRPMSRRISRFSTRPNRGGSSPRRATRRSPNSGPRAKARTPSIWLRENRARRDSMSF